MLLYTYLMIIPHVVQRLKRKLVGKEHEIRTLAEFKKQFDPYIDVFLAHKIAGIGMHTTNEIIHAAVGQAAHISRAGGKRIRPYMAYLGYALTGDDAVSDETLWYALVGIELFHVFALIHDDIIDEAPKRHTVLTTHTLVRDHMVAKGAAHDKARRIGDSQGVLVGDLVFAWSGEALFSNTRVDRVHAVREEFYRMIEEVVLGQMIDVDITNRSDVRAEEIEEKNSLKTARYTFVHPLKIGAALGGDVHTFEPFFEAFGMAIGTAFQVQDDLLDMFGSHDMTGKAILKDIEQGQHTYFTQYIFDFGTDEQKSFLRRVFGNVIPESEKNDVKQLFVDSGAREAGMRIIEEKLDNAKRAIDTYDLPHAHRTAFMAIIELLRHRNS